MKLHILKDNKLIRSINLPRQSVWNAHDLEEFDFIYPKIIPTDAYVFLENSKQWHVKRTGKRVQLAPDPLVPKELKVILLLLGVPL